MKIQTPATFHEHYAAGEIRPPSDRSTGFVFAAVALVFAVVSRGSPVAPWVTLGIAVTLAAVSLIAPALLRPLNVVWFRFGLLLHRIVNPIVMFVVFVLVFVPAGAIMRLLRDPLRSRRSVAEGATYWVDRKGDGSDQGSMSNQF